MSPSTDSRSPKTPVDPRKIGKWARVYAQNRTLGIVMILVFFVIYWMAVELMGVAYRQAMWTLFGTCAAIVAVSLILIVCLSMPRRGQKIIGVFT